MISEEKMQESINSHVANLLAEQVYRKIKADLQNQWSTVIDELATTRRVTENMKTALAESQSLISRLEQLLNQKEAELHQTRRANSKASKILDEALKSLGD